METGGGKLEVLKKTTPFYKYAPLTTTAYSREILLSSPLGEMKAAMMDKIMAVGTVGPDDMDMPVTVYEGYEDYIPDKAVLYREYASKMVLGVLPMSA